MKEKKKEIDSLTLKVSNLETIVKEKSKAIQSMETEVFSCKRDKDRMARIIDTYMDNNYIDNTDSQVESPSTIPLLPQYNDSETNNE